MTQFLGAAFSLFLLMFQEYRENKAKAEEADIEFKLDQSTMQTIVNGAVQKWSMKNIADSAGAAAAFDKADEELKK